MKPKEERHFAQVISLDHAEIWPSEKGNLDFSEVNYVKEKDVAKHLRKYLRKLRSEVKNCKACGALIPELILDMEGSEFYFTCFKIEGKDRVKAETNYEHMGEWCRHFYPKEKKGE